MSNKINMTFFNAYITSRRNEKRDSENKLANIIIT